MDAIDINNAVDTFAEPFGSLSPDTRYGLEGSGTVSDASKEPVVEQTCPQLQHTSQLPGRESTEADDHSQAPSLVVMCRQD